MNKNNIYVKALMMEKIWQILGSDLFAKQLRDIIIKPIENEI